MVPGLGLLGPQQEGLPPGTLDRREPFPPTASLAHLVPGDRGRAAQLSKWEIMAEMASDVKTYAAWVLSNNVGELGFFSRAPLTRRAGYSRF
jgi:hypothetical protein